MAVAGIRIGFDFPELERIRNELRALGNKEANAAILGDALEKAIFPAQLRLREVTPDGPTGNLKRAVSSKVKTYPKDGGAVALVGYERSAVGPSESAQGGSVRAGKDRAFHQWWLEFGTKPRQINRKSIKPYDRRPYTKVMKSGRVVQVQGHTVKAGQNQYIASSWNRLGEFEMEDTPRQPDGSRAVQTKPGYPNAFFKASSTPFQIPPTPAGGVSGQPPVKTAFEDSQSKMAFILTQELRISLSRAWDALTLRDSGSITGV
jgi:hypothetical protein